MMRALICGLTAAFVLMHRPPMAQDRRVAVTFDDLPFQADEATLCDPARIMAVTHGTSSPC